MIELLHAFHWNPTLWPEIRGALGGVWTVIAWPHLHHYIGYRKALAVLIVYLGAPMLSVFALVYFAYEYFFKDRHET